MIFADVICEWSLLYALRTLRIHECSARLFRARGLLLLCWWLSQEHRPDSLTVIHADVAAVLWVSQAKGNMGTECSHTHETDESVWQGESNTRQDTPATGPRRHAIFRTLIKRSFDLKGFWSEIHQQLPKQSFLWPYLLNIWDLRWLQRVPQTEIAIRGAAGRVGPCNTPGCAAGGLRKRWREY